ncbi:Uncharacterised protein [Klebsiella pneumoniae]|nr:Uncharacterised protein [Klebsiella pneumoniae]
MVTGERKAGAGVVPARLGDVQVRAGVLPVVRLEDGDRHAIGNDVGQVDPGLVAELLIGGLHHQHAVEQEVVVARGIRVVLVEHHAELEQLAAAAWGFRDGVQHVVDGVHVDDATDAGD